MIKNFKSTSKRAYRAPWYDTTRWRKERLSFLKENSFCLLCKKENIITPATVVDHIKNISSLPLKERELEFWNTLNWQPLCKKHHESKSGSERHK